MSRWSDNFESHGFRAVWERLRDAVDEASVDDESVNTSVEEVARLKKVVAYIDEILGSLDPELIPLATWDNFHKQAEPCLQHVTAYNSNRNISHIQQANTHADNLLTYVRPYTIPAGKAAKALRTAVRRHADAIDSYVGEFKTRADEVLDGLHGALRNGKASLAQIQSAEESVQKVQAELFGDEETKGVRQNIAELASEIDKKYELISSFYQELFAGVEGEESHKKAIIQAREEILATEAEIGELLEGVSQDVKELLKFHSRVYGNENKDGKRVGGLAEELEHRMEVLEAFEGDQKSRYKALNEEIESLLPGATAAGLATAYREMKDSFDRPIRHASIVFYFSLGLLVFASLVLAIEAVGGEKWVTFVTFDNWDTVLKGLVYKIPFYAPVLWLAFYATKRRSEYQRLHQEYAHKEALAKSYNSYKKQIADLEEKDLKLQKELIAKTIDAISYNASTTLDRKHGDKMLAHELVDRLADVLKDFRTAEQRN